MKYLLFLLLILFSQCHKKATITRFDGIAMTIAYSIQIGDLLNNHQKLEVQETIQKVFDLVDRIFNNWNPDSEISQFNRLKSGERHLLSKELADLLQLVDEVFHLTEKHFDPTVATLQKHWQKYLSKGELPPADSLPLIEESVGWNHIHIDQGLMWKDHSLTSLDLCGISKGHTVDLMIDALKGLGFRNIFVEWGGEIKAVGEHPDHRPWKVIIPSGAIIELIESAIATSGSTYQKWVVDGKCFTHIIDPILKKPCIIHDDASTSITSQQCSLADALATALFIFPKLSSTFTKEAMSDRSARLIE